MQQRRHLPAFGRFTEFLGIGQHTSLYPEHVAAQAVALDELADNTPSFVARHIEFS